MDKNIEIQKNYTSAAKRKWISRIIAVAVILVSMTVMFLFIFPPSEAECTADLVNDSYIKVIFNGEVKDASVSVDFISYDGRIVAEHTLIVLLSGGEPPQADCSAKKAIWHYSSVTSQIIMGGAPRARAICRLVVVYYNCAAASRRRLITL